MFHDLGTILSYADCANVVMATCPVCNDITIAHHIIPV